MSAVGGVGSSTDASHSQVPESPTGDGYAGRPLRPAPSSRRPAGPSQTASPTQDPARHDDVEAYDVDQAPDAEVVAAQDDQQADQDAEHWAANLSLREFAERAIRSRISWVVDPPGAQARSEATSAITPKDAAEAAPAEAPSQAPAAPPSTAGPAVIETEVTRALAGAEQGVTRDWAEQRQRTMDEVRTQFEADQDAAKDAGLFRIVALDESGSPMRAIHDESGAVVSPAPSVFDPAAFKADWLSQPQAGLQALAQQYGLPDQQTLLATRMDVVSLALRGEVGAYEGMPPAGYVMAPPENVQAMDAFLSDPMNQVLILQMGTDPVPPATGPGAREQVRLYGQTRYELLQRLDQAQEKVQADYWQALQAARNDGTHTAAGWHSEQIEQAVTLGTDESGRPIPLTTRDGQPVVETKTVWTLDVQAFSQWYVTQPEVISAQAFGALYGVPHEVAQPMPVDAEGRDLLLYAPPPRLESEVQMSDGSTRRYWIDQDGDVQMDDLLQIDPNDPPQLHSNEAIWFDPALGWVTSTQNRKHGRDWFGTIATLVVVAVVTYVSAGAASGAVYAAAGTTATGAAATGATALIATATIAGAAAGGAAAAAASGVINGGFSWEAVLRGAAIGALTAGANQLAGGDVITGAVSRGLISEATGGDFAEGFVSGLASGWASEVGAEMRADLAAAGLSEVGQAANVMLQAGVTSAVTGQDFGTALASGAANEIVRSDIWSTPQPSDELTGPPVPEGMRATIGQGSQPALDVWSYGDRFDDPPTSPNGLATTGGSSPTLTPEQAQEDFRRTEREYRQATDTGATSVTYQTDDRGLFGTALRATGGDRQAALALLGAWEAESAYTLDRNGSPIVREGQQLSWHDTGAMSEESFARYAQAGAQVLSHNTATTQANAAREQEYEAQREATRFEGQASTASGTASTVPDATPFALVSDTAGNLSTPSSLTPAENVASMRSAMHDVLVGTQTGTDLTEDQRSVAEGVRQSGLAGIAATVEQIRQSGGAEALLQSSEDYYRRNGLNQRLSAEMADRSIDAWLNGDPTDPSTSLALANAFNSLAGGTSMMGGQQAGVARLLSRLADSDLSSARIAERIDAATSTRIYFDDEGRPAVDTTGTRPDAVSLWNTPSASGAADVAAVWGVTTLRPGGARPDIDPVVESGSNRSAANAEAARIDANFYRDGSIADSSMPHSATGPWRSTAELTPAQADAMVMQAIPAGARVTGTLSANEANQLNLKDKPNYDPSYMPGTTIIEFTQNAPSEYVRVSGGRSLPTANWIMRASDIEGLTPEQIAAKYSLFATPTHIGNVTIPAGQPLQASTANGILRGDNPGGGGVQFFIPMDWEDLPRQWFGPTRSLNAY